MSLLIRDVTPADVPALLALNERWVHFLSPLSRERWETISAMSAYHRVAERDGTIVGFLLAFREGTAYDSPNYRWFSERYERFFYVDRIAVSDAVQSSGVGKLLYDDAFAFARTSGVTVIAAEFYTVPLNEISARFHERYGFTEVGTQWIAADKCVSLQVARTT